MRGPSHTGLAALVALGLFVASGVAAEEESSCAIEAAVELESQEPSEGSIRLVFDVRLDARCECASVTYDLVLEEMLPNKQWKAVRETRRVDVRGATAEDRVEHHMAADIKLLGYSAKPVESTPCT